MTSISSPLVSIITVTYNSKNSLQKTIDSIAKQTYENIEYIVIDGLSSDSTIDIIKNNDKVIDYWVSEEDRGIYHAMNKGISVAKGDIIGIVNSDDFLDENAIKQVVDTHLLVKTPNCIVYGNIFLLGSNGEKLGVRKPKFGLFSYLFTTPYKHPAMFATARVYSDLGLYDESVGLGADYHFMLRAIFANIPAYYIDSVLSNVCLIGISTGGHRNATSLDLFKIIRSGTGSLFYALIGVFGRSLHSCFRGRE